MSKISLQPNASGAGTFSIVAPDSNTNRTLTLPDESGAVLSDSSTIDSNNLQSDVYKQDNIVGTVSESNGVPTGAVVESGSNANGEFVRYADGTMICTRSISVNLSPTATKFSEPWPAVFTDTLAVTHGGGTDTSSGNLAGAEGEIVGLRSTTFAVLRTGGRSQGNTRSQRAMGFGRWF